MDESQSVEVAILNADGTQDIERVSCTSSSTPQEVVEKAFRVNKKRKMTTAEKESSLIALRLEGNEKTLIHRLITQGGGVGFIQNGTDMWKLTLEKM